MELSLETIKAIKTIVSAMVAEDAVWIRVSCLGGVEIANRSGETQNITSIAQDVKMVELQNESIPSRLPEGPTDGWIK